MNDLSELILTWLEVMISRSSKTFAKLGLAPVYDFRYTRKFFEDANIDYEAIERAEK